MDSISFVDVGIVIILFVSVLIGVYRGFLRELLTLFAWAVGLALAYTYGEKAGQIFGFDDPVVKEASGMIMIFVTVVLLGFIVKYLVCKWCNISGASTLDRVVGALFGLVRGAAVLVLVCIVLQTGNHDAGWYKNSKLTPYFMESADYAIKNTPREWKDKWQADLDKFMATKTITQENTNTEVNDLVEPAATDSHESPAVDEPSADPSTQSKMEELFAIG